MGVGFRHSKEGNVFFESFLRETWEDLWKISVFAPSFKLSQETREKQSPICLPVRAEILLAMDFMKQVEALCSLETPKKIWPFSTEVLYF